MLHYTRVDLVMFMIYTENELHCTLKLPVKMFVETYER